MSRSILSGTAAILATFIFASQAAAGSHLLPRIRFPKINMGKAVEAAAYPVTKAVVNGGKTVFKTAATAETLGLLPSIGPPGVSSVAKKIIVTIGKR